MKKTTLFTLLLSTSIILSAQWEAGISLGYGVKLHTKNLNITTNEELNCFENTTTFYIFPDSGENITETIPDSSNINLFGNKFLVLNFTYHKKRFFVSNSFLFQFYKSGTNENKYKKEELYYYNDAYYDYLKNEHIYSNTKTLSYSLDFGMNFKLSNFIIGPFGGIRFTYITYNLIDNKTSLYTVDTYNKQDYTIFNYDINLFYIQPSIGIKLTSANKSKIKVFTKVSLMKYTNRLSIFKKSFTLPLIGTTQINGTVINKINQNINRYDIESVEYGNRDNYNLEKLSLNIELGITYTLGKKKENNTNK